MHPCLCVRTKLCNSIDGSCLAESVYLKRLSPFLQDALRSTVHGTRLEITPYRCEIFLQIRGVFALLALLK